VAICIALGVGLAGMLGVLLTSSTWGSRQPQTVPNIVGLTFEEASRSLLEAGFTVERRDSQTDVPSEVGIVSAQTPSAGPAPEDGVVLAYVNKLSSKPPPIESPPEPEPDDPPSITIDSDGDGFVDPAVIEQCTYYRMDPEGYVDTSVRDYGLDPQDVINAMNDACSRF
jgi:hypothetical protein